MDAGQARLLDKHARRESFGHNPIGFLAPVIPSSHDANRHGARTLGGTVRALGERTLNAVTPAAVRTDAKVNARIEQASRDAGELLGALTDRWDHPVDAKRAMKVLKRVEDGDEVFAARVARNIDCPDFERDYPGRMTTLELLHLRCGLMKLDPEARATLDAKTGIFRQSSETLAEHLEIPQMVCRLMSGITHSSWVARGARFQRDEAWSESGNRADIMQELQKALDLGAVEMAHLRSLMRSLPCDELSQMASIHASAPDLDDEDITNVARIVLFERRHEAASRFIASAGQLIESAALVQLGARTPSEFVDEFLKLSRQLDEYNDLCKGDSERVPFDAQHPQVEAVFAELNDCLRVLLTPGVMPLGDLTVDQRTEFHLRLAKTRLIFSRFQGLDDAPGKYPTERELNARDFRTCLRVNNFGRAAVLVAAKLIHDPRHVIATELFWKCIAAGDRLGATYLVQSNAFGNKAAEFVMPLFLAYSFDEKFGEACKFAKSQPGVNLGFGGEDADHLMKLCLVPNQLRSCITQATEGDHRYLRERLDFAMLLVDSGAFGIESGLRAQHVVKVFSRSVVGQALLQERLTPEWLKTHGITDEDWTVFEDARPMQPEPHSTAHPTPPIADSDGMD